MTLMESRQNKTLRHLVRLGQEKKYRQANGEMLCEGEKMLREALASGVVIRTILVRQPHSDALAPLLTQAQDSGAQLFSAEPALFALASDVETPQGVVFSCVPPTYDAQILRQAKNILVLDGIQDPGNMGTILRTADAFAVDAVVLAQGCTDPTAPKVVRSTMGAVFRLPILRLPLQTAVEMLRQNGLPIYAAALTQDAQAVQQVSLRGSAVIIGNEGNGVSQTALQLSDKRVILPMAGRAESLNAGVAAAILLWEMTRPV